jgi:uncharacterized membrane protein
MLKFFQYLLHFTTFSFLLRPIIILNGLFPTLSFYLVILTLETKFYVNNNPHAKINNMYIWRWRIQKFVTCTWGS